MYRVFFPIYREIKQEAAIEELRVAGDWAFLWGTDELRLMPDSGETGIHMKGKGLSIGKHQAAGPRHRTGPAKYGPRISFLWTTGPQ
jgi:hypothetical protein